MRAVVSVLSLSVLVPLTPLSAQAQPTIEPGTRVRITVPDAGLDMRTGTWLGVSEGAFDFVPDGQSSDTGKIQLASVTSLEVSGGHKSRWLPGLLLGFVGGAAVGAVLGYNADIEDMAKEHGAALLAAPGAVLGAGMGALIGSQIKSERWEEIPLDRLRVQPVATRDARFGITASVRF